MNNVNASLIDANLQTYREGVEKNGSLSIKLHLDCKSSSAENKDFLKLAFPPELGFVHNDYVQQSYKNGPLSMNDKKMEMAGGLVIPPTIVVNTPMTSVSFPEIKTNFVEKQEPFSMKKVANFLKELVTESSANKISAAVVPNALLQGFVQDRLNHARTQVSILQMEKTLGADSVKDAKEFLKGQLKSPEQALQDFKSGAADNIKKMETEFKNNVGIASNVFGFQVKDEAKPIIDNGLAFRINNLLGTGNDNTRNAAKANAPGR